MPMYNVIQYSDNYSKTSGSLWQHYRDKSTLNDNGIINNFTGNSALFKFKPKKLVKQELMIQTMLK